MNIFSIFKRYKRRTPTFFQMEMVECGAASLGIILSYYKRFIPIDELRIDCGISRDGCQADNIITAAAKHGLDAEGYEIAVDDFEEDDLPFIVFWRYNHFIVVEDFNSQSVYVNDPALGHRKIPIEQFKNEYSGVAIILKPTKDFSKKGQAKHSLTQIYSYLKNEPVAIAYLFLIGVLFSLLGLISPIFGKMFVDYYLVDFTQSILNLIVIGLSVTLLLTLVLSYIQNHYLIRFQNKLTIAHSDYFLQHIIKLPLDFFAQRYVGDIAFRMQVIRPTIAYITSSIIQASTQCSLIVIYLCFLLYLNWQIAIIVIAISTINVFALSLIVSTKKEKSMQLTVDLAQFYSTSYSSFKIMHSIKASGAEQEAFRKMAGSQAKVANSVHELDEKSTIISIIPSILNMIASAIILIYGAIQIINGTMSVGTLIAIQVITVGFMSPIIFLIQIASQLQDMSGNLAKLDDVYGHKIDPQVDLSYFTSSGRLSLESKPKLSGHIEVRHLSFGFNTIAKPILDDINLTIYPGEHVAFVGLSGSGKSTLTRLIANLYTPWSGDILIDGKRLSEINRLILANSLAVVEQDVILLNGTLRDNFSIWEDLTVSDKAIILAGKDACIHDEISSRENGYDTNVDDNGINFSGGEKQRIDIARALLLEPNILILDEATSELDPIVENTIYDNIKKRGCTTIIVAHRLNTVRNADRIFVFDQGKIVQVGTHDELFSQPGIYERLMSYI